MGEAREDERRGLVLEVERRVSRFRAQTGGSVSLLVWGSGGESESGGCCCCWWEGEGDGAGEEGSPLMVSWLGRSWVAVGGGSSTSLSSCLTGTSSLVS